MILDAPLLQRQELLDSELSRVVAELSARQEVKAVIVFGSYALGKTDDSSDIDLCVIQDTDLIFHNERIRSLRASLTPHVPIDFTVYTPSEFRRFKQRSPFTRDQIIAKGQVLFLRDESLFSPSAPLTLQEERQITIESYQDWFSRAREDLRAAEVLVGEELWNLVCFHSQQAVEKCLKGLIVRREHITPPREHTIEKLIVELPGEWFADLTDDLDYISKFYTITRYPTAVAGELPDGPPGAKDAHRALGIAREVVDRTKQLQDQISKDQEQ